MAAVKKDFSIALKERDGRTLVGFAKKHKLNKQTIYHTLDGDYERPNLKTLQAFIAEDLEEFIHEKYNLYVTAMKLEMAG